jgi:hypothetical protein
MFRTMCLMSTFVALGLLSAGCERKPDSTSTGKPQAAAPTDNRDKHDHAAGDDHAAEDGHADDDHAGHDHGDDGHAHGGEALKLGTREIGEYTVAVVQFGPATDDAAELVFEIDVEGAPSADAVRVLVRNSDGAESLKVKADKVGNHAYDVHVGELPRDLGQGGMLIVEVESASGTTSAEFEIKR